MFRATLKANIKFQSTSQNYCTFSFESQRNVEHWLQSFACTRRTRVLPRGRKYSQHLRELPDRAKNNRHRLEARFREAATSKVEYQLHATNNKYGEKGGAIEISVDSCADRQTHNVWKTDVCQRLMDTKDAKTHVCTWVCVRERGEALDTFTA